MERQKCILLFLCFLFPFFGNVFAQEDREIIEEGKKNKWYMPDYIKIQYAGNIGFLSIGAGYEWWREISQTDILYGYVPECKGEATIHTFTIKNTFRLYQFNIKQKYNISPILGFSVSLEPGQNSYLRLPDKYPEGYYSTNSIYACLNLGVKSKFKFDEKRFFNSIETYAEINTIADYVYYNLKAQEDWEDDIWSLALGVNIFF